MSRVSKNRDQATKIVEWTRWEYLAWSAFMARFSVDSFGSVDDIRYIGDVRQGPRGAPPGSGPGRSSGPPPSKGPGPPTATGGDGRGPLWWVLGILGIMAAVLGLSWITGRVDDLRQRERALIARTGELDNQRKTLVAEEQRLKELQSRLNDRDQALSGRGQSLDQRQAELEKQASSLAEKDDEQRRIRAMIDRRSLAASEVERSVDRLHKELKLRERSLTDEPALSDSLSKIDKRIAVVEDSKPKSGWEQRARTEALADLVREREELILRGSAESYRHEAAVEWELGFLKETAGRLGLAEGVVPENVFEFLDSADIDELEVRWSAKLDQIRKRAALAPGLYDLSMKDAESRLAEIQAAKHKRPADTKAQIAHRLFSKEVTEEVATWMNTREGARDAEIASREQQLLAVDLARRRGNFPAHARLVELSSNPRGLARVVYPDNGADARLVELSSNPGTEPLRERVLARRQSQILELGRALSPATPLSNEVEELLRTRVTDPLKSIDLESRLWIQWKIQPGPEPTNFDRWQASQLTDAQLYELKQYYVGALDHLQLIEQESPEGLQEYVQVDKASVIETLDAINAEIDARIAERGPIIITVFAPHDPGEHATDHFDPTEPPKPDGSPQGAEDQPRKPRGPGGGDFADVTFEFYPDDPRGRPDQPGGAGGVNGNGPRKPPPGGPPHDPGGGDTRGKPDEPGEAGGVKGNGPKKPRPGGPTNDLAGMSRDELLKSERISAEDLKANPEYRTVYWERLRVHMARTGPNSEAERVWAELSLAGFEDQIKILEENRGKLASFKSNYRKYGGNVETVAAYERAVKTNDLAFVRVQNGLDGLVTKSADAAKIQRLQARIKENLGPNPPPDVGKVDPYNDPFMYHTRLDLEDQLAVIQREEDRAKAEYDERIALERQREAERQKQIELATERRRQTELAEARERAARRLTSSGSGLYGDTLAAKSTEELRTLDRTLAVMESSVRDNDSTRLLVTGLREDIAKTLRERSSAAGSGDYLGRPFTESGLWPKSGYETGFPEYTRPGSYKSPFGETYRPPAETYRPPTYRPPVEPYRPPIYRPPPMRFVPRR